MQTHPLRRQRLQRRMEGRSCPPGAGLRNQLSGHLRQLPETGKHPHVRIHRCDEPQGTGSPQRGEMGNVHQKIQIEARVLGDLVMNHVVPVAIEYQTKLIDNAYKMKSLFPEEEAHTLSAENLAIIKAISEHTSFIKKHVDEMVEARKVANRIASEREKAIAYHDTVAPMLEQIRYHIDKLELIVDDQMWTLPKYRELLFVR